MKSRISLKVRAGAAKTQFAGPHGDGWKLQVAAPPVDGKANEAIIKYFARFLRVPSASIRIVTGQTASLKLVEIEGIDSETLHRVILEANGPRKNPGIAAPPED